LLFNNAKQNFQIKKESFSGVKDLTIVTPSIWLANLVKESFLQEYPVKVINNGIDLSIFKPTSSNFAKDYNIENKFIILGVANIWGERKGLKYFAELSKQLEYDEIIVLVGLTDKEKKRLPKNIIGIASTNNIQELAGIYSSVDVFVNPTLEEVLGLTNIESLACGIPVVTFKTGGSSECVDLKTGFVVEKGNLDELLTKIRFIKEQDKSYYAQECIKRASFMYDKDVKFNEYINLYAKVIK
jgi:glycosyltransferase involved in cell wall biosynthesis